MMLLASLGFICMPQGVDYRLHARRLMRLPGLEERIAMRFVVGSGHRAALDDEAALHGDLLFVNCPEGGGYVKSVVAVCKMVRWLRHATTHERALFYGRFEDDHFVAMHLLGADLRGLAGSAAQQHLAYGLPMWLAYDPQKFWAGVDSNLSAATAAMSREDLHLFADGGCFRGVNCQPDDRLGSHSHCPLMAPRAPNLGLRNITFNPRHCGTIERHHVFPFMASASVISGTLARRVASCSYARAFAERAVGLTRGVKESHAGRDFIPGVDALSGHFWQRCGAGSIRLAMLPMGRFHNAPNTSSVRMALAPGEQSVVVHGLKFYRAAAAAERWFLAAYEATRSQNTTTLPPWLFDFAYATSVDPATARHASTRAAAANAALAKEKIYSGLPRHPTMTWRPWTGHLAAAAGRAAAGLEPVPW